MMFERIENTTSVCGWVGMGGWWWVAHQTRATVASSMFLLPPLLPFHCLAIAFVSNLGARGQECFPMASGFFLTSKSVEPFGFSLLRRLCGRCGIQRRKSSVSGVWKSIRNRWTTRYKWNFKPQHTPPAVAVSLSFAPTFPLLWVCLWVWLMTSRGENGNFWGIIDGGMGVGNKNRLDGPFPSILPLGNGTKVLNISHWQRRLLTQNAKLCAVVWWEKQGNQAEEIVYFPIIVWRTVLLDKGEGGWSA